MKFKAGQSGNPRGRRRGTRNRATVLRDALDADGGEVVKTVLALAKGGDLQACRLVLDRICPPLRPVDSLQSVAAKGDTLSDLAASIVREALAGRLNADVARELTTALATVARVKEVDDFERRLVAIEAKLNPQP